MEERIDTERRDGRGRGSDFVAVEIEFHPEVVSDICAVQFVRCLSSPFSSLHRDVVLPLTANIQTFIPSLAFSRFTAAPAVSLNTRACFSKQAFVARTNFVKFVFSVVLQTCLLCKQPPINPILPKFINTPRRIHSCPSRTIISARPTAISSLHGNTPD